MWWGGVESERAGGRTRRLRAGRGGERGRGRRGGKGWRRRSGPGLRKPRHRAFDGLDAAVDALGRAVGRIEDDGAVDMAMPHRCVRTIAAAFLTGASPEADAHCSQRSAGQTLVPHPSASFRLFAWSYHISSWRSSRSTLSGTFRAMSRIVS